MQFTKMRNTWEGADFGGETEGFILYVTGLRKLLVGRLNSEDGRVGFEIYRNKKINY